MNRNILAVIIPALFTSSVVNAVEIYNKDNNRLDLYGSVNGLHYLSKNNSEHGDKFFAHLGVKGETQISDKLIGYGQWEYDSTVNNSTTQVGGGDRTRLSFAGLKFANYGSFDYGRNYGVLHNVESWTNALTKFGGSTYSSPDNFMTNRTNGVATYSNKNFFGLLEGMNFAIQYQGKNNSSGRSIKEQNGEGWALSSTYDICEGISIAAAYASSDRTDHQKLHSNEIGKKAEAWTVGAKYDVNNVYLAAMYAETRNMTPFGGNKFGVDCASHNGQCGGFASKTNNFEVTAQYQLDLGLRPSISYLQSQGKGINVAGKAADQEMLKYISIGSTYEFNKNMSTYVDYKINLLKDNTFTKTTGTATDNIIAMGLSYKF